MNRALNHRKFRKIEAMLRMVEILIKKRDFVYRHVFHNFAAFNVAYYYLLQHLKSIECFGDFRFYLSY